MQTEPSSLPAPIRRRSGLKQTENIELMDQIAIAASLGFELTVLCGFRAKKPFDGVVPELFDSQLIRSLFLVPFHQVFDKIEDAAGLGIVQVAEDDQVDRQRVIG